MENLIIVSILGLVFGVAFFFVEYYEKKLFKLHASLIAGISLAYFFLLVLPEVSGMPEYPFHLEMFEYLFILIGFAFIHISEKLILQKVEAKSQKRVRKLAKREKNLEIVEDNLEMVISNELLNEKLDEATLKEVAQVISGLKKQGEEIKAKIEKTKFKIQKRINKDLNELRFITDFIYHFLIGVILIGLLTIDIITGVLFAVFAWFRTLITNRSEAHLMFSDLDIYEKFEETTQKKIFLAIAMLLGVILNIIFELFFPINLEIIFILFSFISGVIMYTIVREVIPEKEKGKPIYFLAGMIGFSLFVFILKLMGSAI